MKLLRVLQEHEITRLGGTQPIPVDLRIIAATNSNLSDLVEFFINKYNARHTKTYIQSIDPDALKVFEQYSWPGNVRELENVIERAVVQETEKRIRKTSLPDELLGQLSPDKIQVPELDQSNIDLEKLWIKLKRK